MKQDKIEGKRKRILSLILAAAMILTSISIPQTSQTVYADGTQGVAVNAPGTGTYENKTFNSWSCDAAGTAFTDVSANTTTFTMPNTDVEIMANFLNCYPLVIRGYDTIESRPESETTFVSANRPETPSDMEFTGWISGEVLISGEQKMAEVISFKCRLKRPP